MTYPEERHLTHPSAAEKEIQALKKRIKQLTEERDHLLNLLNTVDVFDLDQGSICGKND